MVGGLGSIEFWGIDLGLVRGNVPEDGGGARGNLKADNGAEGTAEEGCDLAKCGIREGS